MGQDASTEAVAGDAGEGFPVRWLAPDFGAMLNRMSKSYYPLDGDRDTGRVPLTVRLQPDRHEDIKMLVRLWTEFDAALGTKREKKWKPSLVVERLIDVGIDGFWQQVGGRPESVEGREDFIKRAVTRLKKQSRSR